MNTNICSSTSTGSNDRTTQDKLRISSHDVAEHHCSALPQCLYIKIDDCDISFLPDTLVNSAAQPGVFALTPITRNWKYEIPGNKHEFVKIARKQLPIMPALDTLSALGHRPFQIRARPEKQGVASRWRLR